MNPLSEEYAKRREMVTLEGVVTLVDLFGGHLEIERILLERRFRERARGFEEVLKFLESMNSMRDNGKTIQRRSKLSEMQKMLEKGQQIFKEQLVRRVLRSSTSYGKDMRKVLSEFRIRSGRPYLNPQTLSLYNDTARDLLLEAGIIELDHETETYTINEDFDSEFIKARYSHGTSPEELHRRIQKNMEIGLAAEVKVVEYEQKMVGTIDSTKVIHIALHNTDAGFDIASMRRENEIDRIQMRMIEVKAVSPIDWRFVFTKNERRVAIENKDTYFLYLVPVMEGKPTVEKMKIIQNPMKELVDPNKWTFEEGDWDIARVRDNG